MERRKKEGIEEKVHALYDYEARYENDLSFKEGDVLILLQKGDDEIEDWWLVKHTDPRNSNTKQKGFVPRNYVRKILEDRIESRGWYRGKINRKEAENQLLARENEAGMFLIRESESSPGDYALSIRDYNQFKGVYVIHYKIITRIDGRVYIAGRTLRSFTSIIELVDHYKVQAEGLCRVLKRACPRPKPVMDDLSRETKDASEIPLELQGAPS